MSIENRHHEKGLSPSPTARLLATGEGWSARELICGAGPGDAPFEECHESATIVAVLGGSFQYRSSHGRVLLHSGAFLLGAAQACFECSHEHGRGDRCVSFRYSPMLMEAIAAAAPGLTRASFSRITLPAAESSAPLLAAIESAVHAGPPPDEELALDLAGAVLERLASDDGETPSVAPRDERRIGAVLRHIEANAAEPLDLRYLADFAAMSKYHFLRSFRRTVGVTPHRYLLQVRLRRAAVMLRETNSPISAVAFECGFGDLSTFNANFRRAYGLAPSRWRGTGGGSGPH